MKYNDLTAKQKELLNAFIQGETLECLNSLNEWIPIGENYFNLTILNRADVRIKPKEPVVKHTYAAIRKSNGVVGPVSDCIQDIGYWDKSNAVSFLQRTYHDGVFVKAEVIPRLELSLGGLI